MKEYHLSEARLCDPFTTNTIVWLERTLAASLSFLYEISIREATFRNFIKAATSLRGQPLFFSRLNMDTSTRRYGSSSSSTASLPITPFPFADLLTGYTITQKLSQLIGLEMVTLPCLPLPNVLAIKIIEQILLSKPFHPILSLEGINNISGLGTSTTVANKKGKEGTSSSVASSSSSVIDSKHVLEAFAASLLYDNHNKDLPSFLYDESNYHEASYNLSYYGSEEKPLLCPSLLSSAVSASDSGDSSSVSSSLYHLYGSTREAVLSMLLTTLVANSTGGNTFTHFLLGLSPSSSSTSGSSTFSFLATNDATSTSSIESFDCLNVIFQLLSTKSQSESHFFLKFPHESLMMYELLYRLIAANNTISVKVLTRMKAFHISFSLFEQFSFFFSLLSFSKEDLIKVLLEIDAISFTSSPSTSKEEIQQMIFMKLSNLYYYINHSLAYLMKILSIEIASSGFSSFSSSAISSVTSSGSSYSSLKSIIQLLFFQYFPSRTQGEGEEEENVGLITAFTYVLNQNDFIENNSFGGEEGGGGRGNIDLSSTLQDLLSNKQYPAVTQCVKDSISVMNSSSSTVTRESESIASPSYKCITIKSCLTKLKDLLPTNQPSSRLPMPSSTSHGFGAPPLSMQQQQHQQTSTSSSSDSMKEIESILQLCILYNQSERYNSSKYHFLLSLRQLLDCCFLSTNASSSASSGSSSLINRIFLELQQQSNSGSNSSSEFKQLILLDVLLPLIKGFVTHFDEIDSITAKEYFMKSIITLIQFLSSSSSLSSVVDNDERKLFMLSIGYKELLESLYSLLSYASSSASLGSLTLISSSGTEKELFLRKKFFSSINGNDGSNNSSSGISTIFPRPESLGGSANNVTLKGYIVVAFHLAMNLFGSSEQMGESNDEGPTGEEKSSFSPKPFYSNDRSSNEFNKQLTVSYSLLSVLSLSSYSLFSLFSSTSSFSPAFTVNRLWLNKMRFP
jgi:hypothetical protein